MYLLILKDSTCIAKVVKYQSTLQQLPLTQRHDVHNSSKRPSDTYQLQVSVVAQFS